MLRVFYALLIFSYLTPAQASLLIKNIRVLDVVEGRFKKKSIVVEGERIQGIYPIAPSNKFDDVIDGEKLYLTPGLIDSHVHLVDIPGFLVERHGKKHPKIVEDYKKQLPRSYLYFGFTTLIDLNVIDRSFLNDFKSRSPRPDLFDCDNALVVANGYPMRFAPKEVRFKENPNFLYDPRQRAKIPKKYKPQNHTPGAAVRRAKKNGAICIKSHFEKGFVPGQGAWPTLTREMLQGIRRAADRFKLPVIIHANSLEAQKFALDFGAHIIGHGMWNWQYAPGPKKLPPEVSSVLDGIIRKRLGYMPTVQVVQGSYSLFDPRYFKQQRIRRVIPRSLWNWYQTKEARWFKKVLARNMAKTGRTPYETFFPATEKVQKVLNYLGTRGGRLLFGSDTPADPTYGNLPGLNGFKEMRQWLRAGIRPIQVLRAATIENAKAFGLQDDYGTVEVGKLANLLVLRKNPLRNVEAFDSIQWVILRGKKIRRSTLAAERAPKK